MRVLQINATYKIGSTGKIMSDINDTIEKKGYVGYMVSCYSPKTHPDNVYVTQKLPGIWEPRKNILISRITGTMGYRNRLDTTRIIKKINEFKPDIIHLHVIHGDWINLKILMEYLKDANIPVVWTMHDCWAFTGRCSHFEVCGCDKWKKQCYKCKNNKVYPISYIFDWSRKMYIHKKKWFTSIKNLTIVTPSEWLANYVKLSFFKDYKINVINNGIDINKYSPRNNYKLQDDRIKDKKIILGVANSWSDLKGLSDFIKLDKLIDHERYVIVLVGLNSSQLKNLPNTIVGISRTNNEDELINIYSEAYVFVNLTYQDNFPTTNIEALACGTPVITYKTGGSPESVSGEVGFVVPQGNVEDVLEKIEKVKHLNRADCRQRAINYYNKYDRFQDYVELYEKMVNKL